MRARRFAHWVAVIASLLIVLGVAGVACRPARIPAPPPHAIEADTFVNEAPYVLRVQCSATDTTLTLQGVQGLPSPGTFRMRMGNERLQVTAVNPALSQISVVRGTENTTASPQPGGTSLVPLLTGAGLQAASAQVSLAPLYVNQLSSYGPSVLAGRQFLPVDGYAVSGDGGGGLFIWNATDARAADGGTIIAVTGVSVGRWDRAHDIGVYNVRWFGAIGNGATDDTTALKAAAAAFQAAMLATGYPTYGGAGYALYFPAGNYLISSPIVFTGLTGGIIRGDGITSSVIRNSASAAMSGAQGLLVLKDCQHVTVQDLQAFPTSIPMQLTGSGLSANGKSFTLAFVRHLSANQLVALVSADGTKAEMVSIVSVAGTTVTIARGSLYAYPAGAYLVGGPLGAIACVGSDTSSPPSHANKFERVSFGGSSGRGSLFGFATTCRGGGPVATVGASNTSGQPTISVTDATQAVVGETYTLWNGIAQALDTLVVRSTSPSGGTVTFTTNLTHTYPAGCYLVSASDANNDEHVFHHCVANNATIAGFGLIGWNSLNHIVTDTEVSGSYAVVSARQGGSVKFIGGDASGYGASYEFGGGQQQPQIIDKTESEGGSGAQLFVAHSVDNCQGLTLWANQVVTKNHPISSGNLIDLTSTYLSVSLNACSLAPGLVGGNSIGLNFVDSSGSGVVVLKGNTQIGADAVTLNGVAMIDMDSTWSSPARFGYSPRETLSNGGSVRTVAPSYGARNGGGGGGLERRPIKAATFVNGDNDNVALQGDADLAVTGPTGAYVLKGFATGNPGQRQRIKFAVNQKLTIKNNSSAGIPILTPTGADIVIPAAGAFVIRDFWCDGKNWNLVQGGTGP